MSFSMDVKEELVKQIPNEEHCRLAELAALLFFYAKVYFEPEIRVVLPVENRAALRKCFTLLNKTFNIRSSVSENEIDFIKEPIEFSGENSNIEAVFDRINLSDPMPLLKKDCCKRAFLRGAFLGTGYVNDPKKAYHLEVLSDRAEYSKLLTYLFLEFNIKPKCSIRKKYFVTYLKEFESVSDVLSLVGAPKSMMDMANMRIVKDVRNNVNRRNNCDMANISKAVNAAAKQLEDIEIIRENIGLSALPESLRMIAVLRMEHPDSSLTELGEMFDPPVGKSGVNHRLRKISEIADGLRIKKE